jgi:hypothetical protein
MVIKEDFIASAFADRSRVPTYSNRFQKQNKHPLRHKASYRINRQVYARQFRTQSTKPTATMCYLEDVFHSVCGHWGSARVYHKCPNTDRVGWERGCWSRQTTGSTSINSSCDRCRCDPEKFAAQSTYLSVSQNKSGRMQAVLCRKGGTTLQSIWKSPSGFFEWRLQH